MAITLVTVTGTYHTPEGSAASGAVQFQLTTPVYQPGQAIVSNILRQATLNGSGSFTIVLSATNDPGTLPPDVAYEVTEEIAGAPTNTYWVIVPFNAAGGVIDIGDLPRVLPTPFPNQSAVLMDTVGQAYGVARLDSTGNVPISELGNVSAVGSLNTYVYSFPGGLITRTGTMRVYVVREFNITQVRASLGTPPTGASVILDLLKNGTTLYTTTGNRPTVGVGQNTVVAALPDTTLLSPGDYLTVNIVQIGTPVPGSDMTVQIEGDTAST